MTDGKKVIHLVGLMGIFCDMAAGIETDTDLDEIVTVLNMLEIHPQMLIDKTVFEAIHVVAKQLAEISLTEEVYQEIEAFNEEISQNPQ